jgi:hypothetical protein
MSLFSLDMNPSYNKSRILNSAFIIILNSKFRKTKIKSSYSLHHELLPMF